MSGEIRGTLGQPHLAAWYRLATPDHAYMAWREAALVAAIAEAQLAGVSTVIDYGGGTGESGRRLAARFGWQEPRVIEVGESQSAVVHADLVLLLDVLEHIQDPVGFLRLLPPSDALIIDVPLWPAFFGAYDVAVGHWRRYTIPQLLAEAWATGWAPTVIRRWGMPLVPYLAWRKLRLGMIPRPDTIQRGFGAPTWLHGVLRVVGRIEARMHPPTGICVIGVFRR